LTPSARRKLWNWARLLGAATVIAAIIWRVGTGSFIDGLRTIDMRSLVAAAGITLMTTCCCAWRWQRVARGLGVELSLRTAISAYYRSQFLNVTLPGGVLGDVHRGVLYGRHAGDVARVLRSVFWERVAGQVTQVIVALFVLTALPSPARGTVAILTLASMALIACVLVLDRTVTRQGSWFQMHVVHTAATDLRGISLNGWLGIFLASCAAVAGYTTIFLIAAHAVGATASPELMLPIAMLVLLAAAVPVNIAGFGPREGAAAWVFAVAGLGASYGVAAATAYGILGLVACLPGAAILALGWLRRDAHTRRP
jgi:uncharacterized membrane protein YbhN (UPF0104 family)